MGALQEYIMLVDASDPYMYSILIPQSSPSPTVLLVDAGHIDEPNIGRTATVLTLSDGDLKLFEG